MISAPWLYALWAWLRNLGSRFYKWRRNDRKGGHYHILIWIGDNERRPWRLVYPSPMLSLLGAYVEMSWMWVVGGVARVRCSGKGPIIDKMVISGALPWALGSARKCAGVELWLGQ